MGEHSLRYAVLSYEGGANIGDEIQSLAVERLLPAVDRRPHRERLHEFCDAEKHLLVMNGWFAYYGELWPPSPSLVPVFFGFHAARATGVLRHFSSPRLVEYFKEHEPIGCRDQPTMDFFQSLGVSAYLAKCLTLTFPRRVDSGQSRDGRVLLVDAEEVPVPRDLARGALRITHRTQPFLQTATTRAMAVDLLNLYRDHAKLVITTRLHCAMPCIALGIPVVFFGDPTDDRFGILRDIGLPIHQFPPRWGRWLRGRRPPPGRPAPYLHAPTPVPMQSVPRLLAKRILVTGERLRVGFSGGVDWNPPVIDIEAEKQRILNAFKDALRHAEERLAGVDLSSRESRVGD